MFELGNTSHHSRLRELLSSSEFSSNPPALVVGNSVNALGVVRSLGQEKIPVIWVTSNPRSVGLVSRFAKTIIIFPDVYYEGFIPSLKMLGNFFLTKPVLFLTHDFQVKLVSLHDNGLSKFYRFTFPPRTIVDNLLSKENFSQIANQENLLIPSTHFIRDFSALEQYISSVRENESYVVKPFEKNDAFEDAFGKALRIRGKKHWEKFQERFEKVNCAILIQRWITGGDHHIWFCLVVFNQQSECVLSFSGKKLKQYKPEIGSTASAEKRNSPEVVNATLQFFKSIKFSGMGSMEFKYCEDDNRFYAIEPTVGRTNLQSEVATVNECNLVAAYYWGLVGKSGEQEVCIQKSESSKTNRVWMRFGADIKSSWFHLREGHITKKEWLQSYLRPISFAVFRMNDPSPFVKLIVQSLTQFPLCLLKKLRGT